ncbi:hypothetical protein [Nostoc sp.]|uniref:hypothetical protein n=1 Tax=Nostoc sp. TaxID=1180 RepID=UPI002FF6F9D9
MVTSKPRKPNPPALLPTREWGFQSLLTFRGEEWKRGFEYTLQLFKQPLKLEQPQTFYRYYSKSGKKIGRDLTTDKYKINVEVIKNLALNQESCKDKGMM